MRLTGMKKRLSCFSIENGNDSLKILLTNEFISKDTFKHPPLYPLPSREGRFLSPLSLEGRG